MIDVIMRFIIVYVKNVTLLQFPPYWGGVGWGYSKYSFLPFTMLFSFVNSFGIHSAPCVLVTNM